MSSGGDAQRDYAFYASHISRVRAILAEDVRPLSGIILSSEERRGRTITSVGGDMVEHFRLRSLALTQLIDIASGEEHEEKKLLHQLRFCTKSVNDEQIEQAREAVEAARMKYDTICSEKEFVIERYIRERNANTVSLMLRKLPSELRELVFKFLHRHLPAVTDIEMDRLSVPNLINKTCSKDNEYNTAFRWAFYAWNMGEENALEFDHYWHRKYSFVLQNDDFVSSLLDNHTRLHGTYLRQVISKIEINILKANCISRHDTIAPVLSNLNPLLSLQNKKATIQLKFDWRPSMQGGTETHKEMWAHVNNFIMGKTLRTLFPLLIQLRQNGHRLCLRDFQSRCKIQFAGGDVFEEIWAVRQQHRLYTPWIWLSAEEKTKLRR